MAERRVFRPLSGDDIVNDRTIVTSGLFQDGVSSINTFFTSSVQSGSTGDYSLDVYKFNPTTNTSASIQFGVAYGHVQGSGSLGGVGVEFSSTSPKPFLEWLLITLTSFFSFFDVVPKIVNRIESITDDLPEKFLPNMPTMPFNLSKSIELPSP